MIFLLFKTKTFNANKKNSKLMELFNFNGEIDIDHDNDINQ